MPNLNKFVKIYTDGACRPNPGHGAIGISILNEKNQELIAHKEFIGYSTNNQAEYRALIKGLELAQQKCTWKAICYSDSLLVIEQLNHGYRIKDRELSKLNKNVRATEIQFRDKVEYRHISSKSPFIKRADKLAREALKEEIGLE
jgi:ribonuclease HI